MKNTIQNIKKNYKWGLLLLSAGIFTGWLLFHPSAGEKRPADMETTDHEHASEAVSVWTCSMHPQVRQDEPGQCPICAMDLVPLDDLQERDETVHPNEIQMSPSAIKLASIQTYKVEKAMPEKELILQ